MMRQKSFNELMLNFLKSEEGETAIGMIVKKAIDQSLVREILFEDGKSEPGRVLEKKEIVNILDHIAKYMPYVEGALRGVQADANVARNRATQTRDMLIQTIENINRAKIPHKIGQQIAHQENLNE